MNGLRYSQLLADLHVAIREKRRGMLTRRPLLLQDNAPAHIAQITLAAAVTQKIEILPHPSHSPDLSPCNFHLFPNLKKNRLRVRDLRPTMM